MSVVEPCHPRFRRFTSAPIVGTPLQLTLHLSVGAVERIVGDSAAAIEPDQGKAIAMTITETKDHEVRTPQPHTDCLISLLLLLCCLLVVRSHPCIHIWRVCSQFWLRGADFVQGFGGVPGRWSVRHGCARASLCIAGHRHCTQAVFCGSQTFHHHWSEFLFQVR